MFSVASSVYAKVTKDGPIGLAMSCYRSHRPRRHYQSEPLCCLYFSVCDHQTPESKKLVFSALLENTNFPVVCLTTLCGFEQCLRWRGSGHSYKRGKNTIKMTTSLAQLLKRLTQSLCYLKHLL